MGCLATLWLHLWQPLQNRNITCYAVSTSGGASGTRRKPVGNYGVGTSNQWSLTYRHRKPVGNPSGTMGWVPQINGVWRTGIGNPSETHRKLFENFQRRKPVGNPSGTMGWVPQINGVWRTGIGNPSETHRKLFSVHNSHLAFTRNIASGWDHVFWSGRETQLVDFGLKYPQYPHVIHNFLLLHFGRLWLYLLHRRMRESSQTCSRDSLVQCRLDWGETFQTIGQTCCRL